MGTDKTRQMGKGNNETREQEGVTWKSDHWRLQRNSQIKGVSQGSGQAGSPETAAMSDSWCPERLAGLFTKSCWWLILWMASPLRWTERAAAWTHTQSCSFRAAHESSRRLCQSSLIVHLEHHFRDTFLEITAKIMSAFKTIILYFNSFDYKSFIALFYLKISFQKATRPFYDNQFH